MSRHYGTAIEPDQEPDTLEPDEDLLSEREHRDYSEMQAELDEFYENIFWEPDLEALESDLEKELSRIEYLEER